MTEGPRQDLPKVTSDGVAIVFGVMSILTLVGGYILGERIIDDYMSYCQIWCMDNQAALLSDWSDTRIPSLKITPLMTSPRSS